MADLNLTFGIELEFLVICTENANPHNVISEQLHNAGILVTGHNTANNMVQADHASPQLYDRWIVQREHLELSPAEQEIFKKDLFKKGWKLENAEITSRKLNFFTEDWSGEVEAVLETLRRINESESYHLITNASTGLHVHVGNDTQPIPLRTAKNIYQLLTAFERQLDHLHSSDRIEVPNSPCGTDSHLPPCVFHTLKTQASGVAEWPRSSTAFIDIEHVETYAALGKLFTPYIREDDRELSGHISAINFDNLFSVNENDRSTATGTVEFRQHCGTLDIQAINAWIRLTTTIVRFAHEATDAEFVYLLTRAFEYDYTLRDLLLGIELSLEVVDYYTNLSAGGNEAGTTVTALPPTSVTNLGDSDKLMHDSDPALPNIVGSAGTVATAPFFSTSPSLGDSHPASSASTPLFPPTATEAGTTPTAAPPPHSLLRRDSHHPLTDPTLLLTLNARENQERKSTTTVTATIAEKAQSGIYGYAPDGPRLVAPSYQWIQDSLHAAIARLPEVR